MSSLVRRLSIRMMKRAGYTREKLVMSKDPNGKPELRKVRRGGEITDREGNPIGRHWPMPRVTRKPEGRKFNRLSVARGSRRGKRNAPYIARRKALAS